MTIQMLRFKLVHVSAREQLQACLRFKLMFNSRRGECGLAEHNQWQVDEIQTSRST